MHLGCVYTIYTYLGDPVAHCTIRVRLLDRSRQFNIPSATIYSLRHFHTHAVRICTVPQNGIRKVHLGFVYTNYTYLGGPVEHCTIDVRLRDRSRQFTIPYATICCLRHFLTHAERICTVPQSWTGTLHLRFMYTNYTYLGHPVGRCTIRVRLRDRSRLFTIPYATICSLRHFRTPAVCICTVPRNSTRTVHLGCVYTNYT